MWYYRWYLDTSVAPHDSFTFHALQHKLKWINSIDHNYKSFPNKKHFSHILHSLLFNKFKCTHWLTGGVSVTMRASQWNKKFKILCVLTDWCSSFLRQFSQIFWFTDSRNSTGNCISQFEQNQLSVIPLEFVGQYLLDCKICFNFTFSCFLSLANDSWWVLEQLGVSHLHSGKSLCSH